MPPPRFAAAEAADAERVSSLLPRHDGAAAR